MAHVDTQHTPRRTLAIDPSTREIGHAILEANDLLYFGVHTLRHRTSTRRLLADGQRVVADLITRFDPHLLVIAKADDAKSKRSARLHGVVVEIQRCAHQHGVRVAAYAPTTVKKTITGNGAATKREVAETLVRWYPYLAKYLRTDRRTREHYWEHMFAAVALGLTGSEHASKHSLTPHRRSGDAQERVRLP